jgi:hypothetical protein
MNDKNDRRFLVDGEGVSRNGSGYNKNLAIGLVIPNWKWWGRGEALRMICDGILKQCPYSSQPTQSQLTTITRENACTYEAPDGVHVLFVSNVPSTVSFLPNLSSDNLLSLHSTESEGMTCRQCARKLITLGPYTFPLFQPNEFDHFFRFYQQQELTHHSHSSPTSFPQNLPSESPPHQSSQTKSPISQISSLPLTSSSAIYAYHTHLRLSIVIDVSPSMARLRPGSDISYFREIYTTLQHSLTALLKRIYVTLRQQNEANISETYFYEPEILLSVAAFSGNNDTPQYLIHGHVLNRTTRNTILHDLKTQLVRLETQACEILISDRRNVSGFTSDPFTSFNNRTER